MTKGKKAVIYARVSTVRQAEDELPIDSQVNQCRKRADELGASVVKTFIDAGLSGRTDQRPEFRDAIDFCELTCPDYFITWSTSRFARSKYDAALYKMRLQRCGTQIVYISFPVERDTDAGFLTESILEIFDEFHSRQIASDTKRSMLRLASQGYFCGGRPPFGFASVPSDCGKHRVLQRVEEEAEIAELIFELRESGIGAKSIADDLNIQGFTNRGRRWEQRAVLTVLRSEALIGMVVFNRKDRATQRRRPTDQWVRVRSHEPVIDEARWHLVQQMIDDDAPKRAGGSPRSTLLFTGIARCHCGAALQTETATGRSGKRYHYYQCLRAKRGDGCSGRRLPAAAFDQHVLGVIGKQIFSPENLRTVMADIAEISIESRKNRNSRIRKKQSQIKTIEDRQRNLFAVLELHGRDAPDLGDLTTRLRHNKAEIERLEQQLDEIEREEYPDIQITEADINDMQSFLMQAITSPENIKTARALLAELIAEISVGSEQITIRYRPEYLLQAAPVRSEVNWLPGRHLLRTINSDLPPQMRAA